PQRLGVARRLPRAAVDDELLRMLGDLGVEVVEKHAQRRLRRPRPRVEIRSPRRTDAREVAAQRVDGRVESARRAHYSSSRRCAAIRLRQLRQPHRVATRKKAAANTSARPSEPPVASATITTTTAIPP